MKVEALKSFAGEISMYKGEIRDIESGDTLSDLLSVNYVKCVDEVEEATDEVKETTEKVKKTNKKGVS